MRTTKAGFLASLRTSSVVIATWIGLGPTGCCGGYMGRLRTTKEAFLWPLR